MREYPSPRFQPVLPNWLSLKHFQEAINKRVTFGMCTFWFFGEVLFFDVRLICEQVRDVFERIASGPLEALPCKSMIPITRKGGFGIYTDFST